MQVTGINNAQSLVRCMMPMNVPKKGALWEKCTGTEVRIGLRESQAPRVTLPLNFSHIMEASSGIPQWCDA